MEPHADFWQWAMANWAREESGRLAALEEAIGIIFRLGDTVFNTPNHHGQPEFRAAMVRAGLEAAALEVGAASTKGRTMAGL